MNDTTLNGARRYIASHPVSPDVWPEELRDRTRQSIDRIVLHAVGVDPTRIEDTLIALYNEITGYTRKLKSLELEAQLNRHGSGGEVTNIRDLAQDVWAHVNSEGLPARPIPDDFISRGMDTRTITIPPGRAEVVQPGLFDQEDGYPCRFGNMTVRFDSPGERDYCFTLAKAGIHREVPMPVDADDCSHLAREMQQYLSIVNRAVWATVSDLTNDGELQRRIAQEALRRVLQQ